MLITWRSMVQFHLFQHTGRGAAGSGRLPCKQNISSVRIRIAPQKYFFRIKNYPTFAAWIFVNIHGSHRLPLVRGFRVCKTLNILHYTGPATSAGFLFYSVLRKSGYSGLVWDQERTGSNPVHATKGMVWVRISFYSLTVERPRVFTHRWCNGSTAASKPACKSSNLFLCAKMIAYPMTVAG